MFCILNVILNESAHHAENSPKERKEIMKKHIVMVAAMLAMSATAAFAITSIKNTKHDLSNGLLKATYSSTGTEICVYCHTPHNTVGLAPLWNRNNPSYGNFDMYRSSQYLSNAVQGAGAKLGSGSVSIFCMSCHDGVTSLGAIARPQVSGGTSVGVTIADNSTRLGTDLTNDHPINFDYDAAYTQKQIAGLTGVSALFSRTEVANKFNTANSFAGANNSIVSLVPKAGPFYAAGGAAGSGSFMECASCHNVHDNSATYFLRKNNKGSELCLACHNK